MQFTMTEKFSVHIEINPKNELSGRNVGFEHACLWIRSSTQDIKTVDTKNGREERNARTSKEVKKSLFELSSQQLLQTFMGRSSSSRYSLSLSLRSIVCTGLHRDKHNRSTGAKTYQAAQQHAQDQQAECGRDGSSLFGWGPRHQGEPFPI